jgi:hypothetical protein
MHTQEMISTHPEVKGSVNAALIACVDACFDCAQTCIACADACLAEQSVAELRQCIRLNLDCADVCAATGALGSRRTGSNEVLKRTIETCAEACRACGEVRASCCSPCPLPDLRRGLPPVRGGMPQRRGVHHAGALPAARRSCLALGTRGEESVLE